MLHGVGTDICEIARIERALARFGPRLVRRVAGGDADAEKLMNQPAKLARRWALKEAVAKALGTGIGGALSFTGIHVFHAPNGAVQVQLPAHFGVRVLASVADDGAYAVAFVVLEKLAKRA
jgi:holo-[acyl-carrier protein] synthase